MGLKSGMTDNPKKQSRPCHGRSPRYVGVHPGTKSLVPDISKLSVPVDLFAVRAFMERDAGISKDQVSLTLASIKPQH